MTEEYEEGDVIIDGKGNFLTYSEDGEDGDNWVGHGGEWSGPMSEIPQPVTRLYTLNGKQWAEYQRLKEFTEWTLKDSVTRNAVATLWSMFKHEKEAA